MVISHNLPAINSYNRLNANVTGLGKASEKLSSGYRINDAADDAAGLAVSEKMRSQLRGLNQAKRNTQDGISYIQTAEGALNDMHSILQRGRELAEEAANGTYDDATDRTALQLELDQLRDEVDQTAMTDFNGKYVFDPTGATPPDAFGNAAKMAESSGKVEGVILRTAGGGAIDTTVVKYAAIAGMSTGTGMGFSEKALTDYVNQLKTTYVPKMLGGIVSALPNSAKPTVDGMTIGFEFVNRNDDTLAFVSNRYSHFNYTTAGSQQLNLSINLKYLTESGGKIDMTPDMNTTIAHEMTHAVMDDIVTSGMVGAGLAKDDEFPDWFVEGAAQCIGGAMNYVSEILPYKVGTNNSSYTDGQVLAQAADRQPTDSDIAAYLKELSTSGDSLMPYEQGYLATMYLGWLVGGKGNVDKATIAKGLDTTLKQIAGPPARSLETVVKTVGFTSLSDFVTKFGDSASVDFTKKLIAATGAHREVNAFNDGNFIKFSFSGMISDDSGTGSIISPSGLSGTKKSLLDINVVSDYFELDPYSQYGKDLVKDLGVSGDKIFEGGGATKPAETNPGPITPLDPPADIPVDPYDPDQPDPDDPNDPDNPNSPGGSDSQTPEGLVLQIGARSKDAVDFSFLYKSDALGNLKSDLCCTAKGLGLNKVSFTSQEKANDAIDKFDHAISKVSLMRATFGSVQNRLEHKLNTLTVNNENLTAAESQIRDTDMASEMMNYTKYQILQNAAQSMLAQANQQPQSVLSLLG